MIYFLYYLSILIYIYIYTHISQKTKDKDPFCVHIFTLKHFKLVSKRHDPALSFHLCLSPATNTSTAVRHRTYPQQYPNMGRLFQHVPTKEVSKSETSTHAPTRHFSRHHPPARVSHAPISSHWNSDATPRFSSPPYPRFVSALILSFWCCLDCGFVHLCPLAYICFLKFCATHLLLDTCPVFLKITFMNSTLTSTPSPLSGTPTITTQKLN